jgi:hypothetical protein
MKDDSHTAFPSNTHDYSVVQGLPMRDYFASVALQGALSYPNTDIADHRLKVYAEFAYRMADAMLAEREK